MNGANVVQNGAMKKVNSLLFSLLTFCFVPPQGLKGCPFLNLYSIGISVIVFDYPCFA